MKKTYCTSLPVLMHHYINNSQNSLALTPHLFREHCAYLAHKKWVSVSLQEAEEFFLGKESLPKKSFLLSFDDGYLDNYLYALPIMQEYGYKGVMFAVSNRLDQEQRETIPLEQALVQRDISQKAIREEKDPLLQQVLEPIHQDTQGFYIRKDLFCKEAEAYAMHTHGTLSVAGHSYGHFGVFTAPTYNDFTIPKNQKRTFYLTSYGTIWGLPQFPIKPSLAHRAFLPNPQLIEMIQLFVPQEREQARLFFQNENSLKELQRRVQGFAKNMGRFETNQEMHERMWQEIHLGKVSLEKILGQKLRSFCWPWGAYNKEAWHLAKDAGYEVFFTTKEGSNPFGQAHAVKRFKAKALAPSWLHKRLCIYAQPTIGALYAKIRI